MTVLKNTIPTEILKFRLDFDDEMKLSLNKVWSGGAATPWIRKKASDLWHDSLFYFLEDNKIKSIDEKVDIYLKYYFSTGDSGGKRQLDSSNCSAMSKMIEDGLRYNKVKNPKGILIDDTNVQVGWFAQHSIQLTLSERKALDSSFVEVSIRTHSKEI